MALTRDSNYYRWDRGDVAPLSLHFATPEFTCPCSNASCKQQLISVDLVSKLESTRVSLAAPVTIDSGYRCAAHQAELKARGFETANGVSQHELGNAADVRAKDVQALEKELAVRFLAIGAGHGWFHVDLRADKPRYWTYSSR